MRSLPNAKAMPRLSSSSFPCRVSRRALVTPVLALPFFGSASGRAATEPLPLSEAVARVAERYEGRLLDARLTPGRTPEGTDLVYELRWLTPAGDVLRARVDARTGDMVEVDGPGQFAAQRPAR